MLIADSASAQSANAVSVGARVRVVLPDSLRATPFAPRERALIGTVVRLTDDTLVLQMTAADTVRLHRAVIRQIAVSQGAARGRSAMEQALSAGIAFGSAAYLSTDRRRTGRSEGALGAALAGVGVGALLGTLRPYERWPRTTTRFGLCSHRNTVQAGSRAAN